jgi:GLPGLI family protein
MARYFFLGLLLFLLACNYTNAQHDYTVVYSHTYSATSGNQGNGQSKREEVLFINDDTLCYFQFHFNKRMVRKESIGNKPVNHAVYWYPKSGHVIYEYAGNQTVLEKDSMRSRNWVLKTDSATIQGYKCFRAEMDSIVAWYTPAINIHVGPAYYYGLPRLILQVYDPKRNWFISATSVLHNSPRILLPVGLKEIRPVNQ